MGLVQIIKRKENNNSCSKVVGALTTAETNRQTKFWVKRVQQRNHETKAFKEDRHQLNLQKNDEAIYVCEGRIQGHYHVYLPGNELLSEKIVSHVHKLSCHGGVGMTMAKYREK